MDFCEVQKTIQQKFSPQTAQTFFVYNSDAKRSKTLFGSILFADISGFTRLSSTLTAEELKFHINEYFSSMIRVVDKYGGDVIKFCGDAVMIMWPVETTSSSDIKEATVEVALLCAKDILKDCGCYDRMIESNRTEVSLRLHCAISCGLIHCMCLGNTERNEFIISGDPLNQLSAALKDGGMGSVVLSKAAHEMVSSRFDFEVTSHGGFSLLSPRTTSTSSGPNSTKYTSMIARSSSRVIQRLSSQASRLLSLKSHSHVDSVTSEGDTDNYGNNQKAPTSQNDAFENQLPLKQIHSDPSIRAVLNFLKYNNLSKLENKSYPLISLVPKDIRKNIQDGTEHLLAEIRVVTTVFIEIIGLETDFSKGLHRRPQNVLRTVLSILAKNGGSLRQYVVDDKGCVIILAFGLPDSSYSDNAARSIRTTLAIKKTLKSFNIQSRAGIAQGNVYCGLVGSSTRCEYAMMGSSVNLAARLMSACQESGILVNEEVHFEASSEYEFCPQPKIIAKGYTHPVDVFTPIVNFTTGNLNKVSLFEQSSEDSLNNSIPFVGRRKELGMIVSVLDDDIKHNIILSGVASVGKTRFLHEIYKHLLVNKAMNKVIVLSGSENRSGSEYYLLREIISKILSVETTEGSPYRANTMSSNLSEDDYSDDMHSSLPSKLSAKNFVQDNASISGGSSSQSLNHHSYRHLDNSPDKLKKGLASTLHRDNSSKESKDGKELIINMSMSRSLSKRRLSKQSSQGSFWDMKQNNFIVLWLSKHYKHPAFNAICDSVMTRNLSDKIEYESDNSPSVIKHRDEAFVNNLIPLLKEFLHICYADNEVTEQLCHEERIRLQLELCAAIIQITLESDGALILDNLHFSDELSLRVILSVISDLKSGYFIASMNSDLLHATSKIFDGRTVDDHQFESLSSNISQYIRQMSRISSCVHIATFASDDAVKMLHKVLGPKLSAAHPELSDHKSINQLLDHSGGYPYLLHSLLISLKKELITGKFHDISHLSSGKNSIILSIYDRLPLGEQMVMKIACVIGHTFTSSIIEPCLQKLDPNGKVDIDMALQSLVKENLIQRFHIQSHNPMNFGDNNFHRHRSNDAVISITSSTINETNHPSRYGFSKPQHQSHPTDLVYFRFSDSSIKRVIDELMLRQQKEELHAMIGLLLEDHILNDEDFFITVNHFYLSNNMCKKLQYIELALSHAYYNGVIPDILKYGQYLISLASGMSLNRLLEYCTASNHKERKMISNYNPRHLIGSAVHARVSPTTTTTWRIWYTLQDFHTEICTQIESLENLQMIGHNIPTITYSVYSSVEEKSDGIYTRSEFQDMIASWIGMIACAFFLDGNVQYAWNSALLAIHGFKLSLKTVSALSCLHPERMFSPFLRESILRILLLLCQIMILRGDMEGCEKIIKYIYVRYHDGIKSYSIGNISLFLLNDIVLMVNYFSTSACKFDIQQNVDDQYSIDICAEVAIHSAYEACMLSCKGNFKHARTSLVHGIETFVAINSSFGEQALRIFNCYLLILQSKMIEAMPIIKNISSTKVSLPYIVRRWVIELEAFYFIIQQKYHDALLILESFTQSTTHGEIGGIISALKGYCLVFIEGRLNDAVNFITHACSRMKLKNINNPIVGVFIYLAAYAAFEIGENEPYLENNNNQRNFHDMNVSKSENHLLTITIKRDMNTFGTELTSKLLKSSQQIGILKIFHAILLLKSMKSNITTNNVKNCRKMELQIQNTLQLFPECSMGLMKLQEELSIFVYKLNGLENMEAKYLVDIDDINNQDEQNL